MSIIAYKDLELPLEKLVDPSTKKNVADILCPKQNCNCVILRKNAASLVERDGSKLQLPAASLPENSIVEENDGYFWLVKDMMNFENIGFSKTVNTIKYLSCADCDLGPLGYHDTTEPKEYVIHLQRAKYRFPK